MSKKKVVIAGMVGNALEWYDYALYGHFAAIISALYFPSESVYVSLIATFGVFAAGFAMRPIGAVLFGWIGDTYGRKKALAISILLMAIPTACIGILPTYEQIGILAPILLTIIRLLQGLSLGGEFSGAITFICEHSKDHQRGIAGSTTMSSLVIGILLGSAVATGFAEILTEEDLKTWGWRIPFIIGLAIGLVGFYIRHHLDESPNFESAKAEGRISKHPVRDAFRHHRKPMLQGIGVYLSVTVPFYTLAVFMNTYLSKILGHSIADALMVNTLAMFILLLCIPISGYVSDKVGRKKVLIFTAYGFLLFALPIFLLLGSSSFSHMIIGAVIFATLVGIYLGPVPALLVELFPTSVRYTGMALSYNVCAAVFGGTTPMLITWLMNSTGDNMIGAYYMMFCAVVSIITLHGYRDRFRYSKV